MDNLFTLYRKSNKWTHYVNCVSLLVKPSNPDSNALAIILFSLISLFNHYYFQFICLTR